MKGYVGNGLCLPVSGSTLETTLGGKILRRGFALLCNTLWIFYGSKLVMEYGVRVRMCTFRAQGCLPNSA